MYNHIVSGPSSGSEQGIQLGGPEGGRLLLQPPAQIPGQLTLQDMLNRTLMLLREPGPDTGQPYPQLGDFTQSTITRDLNIALGQFVGDTGIAPDLSDVMKNFPVFPVLDYPVPPDLVSLSNVEYTQAGQQPYTMIGLSFSDWTLKFGTVQPTMPQGNPYYYRQPYAGYMRLLPTPTQGNYLGPGLGYITVSGSPTVGQTITATLRNPGFTAITTLPYTVLSSDTPSTIANELATNINASAACTGSTAFLQSPSVNQNVLSLSAITPPGTSITFYATITGVGATVAPTIATTLSPNGDIMTFYYTSSGTTLTFLGDTCGLPPHLHMAPVYRVLADYWLVKENPAMAKAYLDRYDIMVKNGKSFTFDTNRSTQPTIAGSTYDDALGLG